MIRVWDSSNGSEKLRLQGPDGTVFRIAFSPDGKSVVSQAPAVARVWDLESGASRSMVEGQTDPVAIAHGSRLFPWRIVCNNNIETTIESVANDQIVAYWPTYLRCIVTHSCGEIWAGVSGDHLWLFTLEGHADGE
jgi:WD40 repeat protein